MATPTIDALAQAIATDLNAEVDYWPEFERKEITSERILVVPSGIDYKQLSRADVQTDYHFSVGVLRRIRNEDEVSDLVERVQSFGRTMVGRKFGSIRCVEVKYEPLYSIDLLRERRQFTAVIRLTFRTIG